MWPTYITGTYTVDVADGTYAEGISLRRFVCSGDGSILITGNTTTPANVTFTGTVSNGSSTYGLLVDGPVIAELEGCRINVTADNGAQSVRGARLTLDRCTVTGTLTRAVRADDAARVTFQGDCTVSGWSTSGLFAADNAKLHFNVAGTLTMPGPGTSGTGVHMVGNSQFLIFSGSGLNITITGVQYGFQFGFSCHFTHQGTASTITVDNASTPATSALVLCTDNSGWSVTSGAAVVADNLTVVFQATTKSYIEYITASLTATNIAIGTESEAFDGLVQAF
jgi:hypothetical protein